MHVQEVSDKRPVSRNTSENSAMFSFANSPFFQPFVMDVAVAGKHVDELFIYIVHISQKKGV
jgi:hypothetical protein